MSDTEITDHHEMAARYLEQCEEALEECQMILDTVEGILETSPKPSEYLRW